jgi:arginase
MDARWMVTPFFFEQPEPGLRAAVPAGADCALTPVTGVADRSPASLATLHRPIAAFVETCARDGVLPVSIAGDCAASLPVMAGLQAAGLEPVLVWLDAHGDFNTAETSPGGFLGGMPLAMMVGRGDLAIGRNAGLAPVAERDVWLIDARDLDPHERVALANAQINRLDMAGLAGLRLTRPVHLHIDNDVVDAAQVPANNFPVPGGPSLDSTIAACTRFAAANDIRALSFSGWNGALDRDGRTAAACASLIGAVARASCR